jgi:hypothetical protein
MCGSAIVEGRTISSGASRSGRSSPALSLSPALPAPADSLQLSLSLRRFSSLRRFPLCQIRSPFSSPFSLGGRPPLSSGRSRLSPALSPADLLSDRSPQVLSFFLSFFVSAFFVFELHVMFEILNVSTLGQLVK